MLQVPIQPVPSQQVLCVLGGQNCQLSVYLRNESLFVDINVNGTDICLASLAHNGVPLDARNSYSGFQGNLFFIDTQGVDDPLYTGLGSRWILIYLTPAELLLTTPVFGPEMNMGPIITLSATLEVTAPAPGPFSVAHGLGLTPFIISIIPTNAGAIWGQVSFVDGTNVNLVASNTGVTAIVLVFTIVTGIQIEDPAVTLLVSSPAPGPFSVAHGLGVVPSFIKILPTSDGALWGQTPLFDDTYIYLEASDIGQTATITVFIPSDVTQDIQGPIINLAVSSPAPGPFSVAHGLSSIPSEIDVLMVSDGSIRAQTPAFDDTDIFLVASDTGLAANVFIYL